MLHISSWGCLSLVLLVLAMPGEAWAGEPKPRDCVTAGCHEKYEKTPAHSQVAGSACLVCHGEHPSKPPKPGEKVATVGCTSQGCHEKDTDPTLLSHEPYEFEWCHVCHEHSVNFLRPADRKQIELCLKCHDKKVVPAGVKGRDHAAAVSVHPPREKGVIKCTFCHPHHNASKTLEDGTENRDRLNKPERQLCAQCHERMTSHHITADGKQIEAKHPEAAKLRCTACHYTHYSPHKSLLKNTLAADKRCDKCHK